MKNQLIVQLQLFKGNKILRDENGKIETQHETFKVQHGNIEWENMKKAWPQMGFGTFKILGVNEITSKGLVPVEDYSDIEAELKAVFTTAKPDAPKNDNSAVIKEQKKTIEAQAQAIAEQGATIAELQKQMREFMEAHKIPDPTIEDSYTEDEKASLLYPKWIEFHKLTGKRPKINWNSDTLDAEIEKAKTKNS